MAGGIGVNEAWTRLVCESTTSKRGTDGVASVAREKEHPE
jgi:hypothetical protein